MIQCFPIIYIIGGVYVVKMGQIKDMDHLTSEWPGVGCDDLQFFCKKSFGPLIFECRLPKETSLSIWGTFTMFPIPPSSTTLVTEFFEERGKMDFPHFLVFYLARWFHMLLNPHQLPKQTIWYAWNYFGVPPYMCTGVTLVTENPFTGRKAQKCPNVLKEH